MAAEEQGWGGRLLVMELDSGSFYIWQKPPVDRYPSAPETRQRICAPGNWGTHHGTTGFPVSRWRVRTDTQGYSLTYIHMLHPMCTYVHTHTHTHTHTHIHLVFLNRQGGKAQTSGVLPGKIRHRAAARNELTLSWSALWYGSWSAKGIDLF